MDSDEDLLRAPGAADLTFGSLLSEMIRCMHRRVETLDREAPHRYYTECLQCGGTDNARPVGARQSIERVAHKPDCLMARHLPRLRAMAREGVT